MPARNPKPTTTPRLSPKERATALRSAVSRTSITPAVQVCSVPPGAVPNPALIRLILKHDELLAAGNSDTHSEAISDTLLNRSYELFHEACEIPAATPADLIAKFALIEPELRDATSGHGAMADSALTVLAADLKRVLHAESLKVTPAAEPQGTADLSDLTLPQLLTLHETVRSLWLSATAELQAPWCWDDRRENYNAAGKALNGECDRLARLLDAIPAEAKRRSVNEDGFGDDRLALLIRYELAVEGRIISQDLIAEIADAWGEAPRG